ncbi:hypothetical protein YC2023_011643 [Brassica napus]
MLKEFGVCPLSVEIDLSVAAPSIEFKDPFDLKGEPKWITASSRHYKKKSCYALGYKNNKSYRNYKILSERMVTYWEVIRDTVRVRPKHGERPGGDCRVSKQVFQALKS